VERLLNPELIGKPVVVGGRLGSRGVVTAASYEVRTYGVHSGMSIVEASRLAPHAVFIPGTHGVYSGYTTRVREVLERYTPEVRTASIDEFYLDFSGCERLYRRPEHGDDDATIEATVRDMRQAIQRDVSLPASAGIGVSRRIAKMASRRAKPAGVYMVRCGEEWSFLAPQPVRAFPGIGPSTESRLQSAGIDTLGQLMTLPPGPRRSRFSGLAESVRAAAERRDRLGRERPAFREHGQFGSTLGSISNGCTFAEDIRDPSSVETHLLGLVDRVSWRARKRGVLARTVTLTLRYADFDTITRSRTGPATAETERLRATVVDLFRKNRTRRMAVRMVAVAVSNLVQPRPQLSLPLGAEPAPVSQAIDAVRSKHGFDAIKVGSTGGLRFHRTGIAPPAVASKT